MDSRERELVAANELVGSTGRRAASAESDLVRVKEALRAAEARAAAAQSEVGALRTQLQVGVWQLQVGVAQLAPTSFISSPAELRRQLNCIILLCQGAISSQQMDSRKLEGGQRDIAQKESQIDRLSLRLQEEGSKATALRQQVADISSQHVKVRLLSKSH